MKAIWCGSCGEALSNDDVALNLRLSGRGTARFYCGPCLGRETGCSPAEIEELKQHFKNIGCELFARAYVEPESNRKERGTP